MANLAHIDNLLSEVNNLENSEKILFFHEMNKLIEVIGTIEDDDDEEISFESAFGLWKDRPVTVESIRQKAWKQV